MTTPPAGSFRAISDSVLGVTEDGWFVQPVAPGINLVVNPAVMALTKGLSRAASYMYLFVLLDLRRQADPVHRTIGNEVCWYFQDIEPTRDEEEVQLFPDLESFHRAAIELYQHSLVFHDEGSVTYTTLVEGLILGPAEGHVHFLVSDFSMKHLHFYSPEEDEAGGLFVASPFHPPTTDEVN